jgi:hypothetical protein
MTGQSYSVLQNISIARDAQLPHQNGSRLLRTIRAHEFSSKHVSLSKFVG